MMFTSMAESKNDVDVTSSQAQSGPDNAYQPGEVVGSKEHSELDTEQPGEHESEALPTDSDQTDALVTAKNNFDENEETFHNSTNVHAPSDTLGHLIVVDEVYADVETPSSETVKEDGKSTTQTNEENVTVPEPSDDGASVITSQPSVESQITKTDSDTAPQAVIDEVSANGPADNEKEEGEISSEEEVIRKEPTSTFSQTRTHVVVRRSPRVTRTKRIVRRPPPARGANDSYSKILQDYKAHQRRRKSGDEVTRKSGDENTENLSILRIAALRSVAKKKGSRSDSTEDQPIPIADRSLRNEEDIVNAVTELPLSQGPDLAKETPTAKLARKKKWEAVAKQLGAVGTSEVTPSTAAVVAEVLSEKQPGNIQHNNEGKETMKIDSCYDITGVEPAVAVGGAEQVMEVENSNQLVEETPASDLPTVNRSVPPVSMGGVTSSTPPPQSVVVNLAALGKVRGKKKPLVSERALRTEKIMTAIANLGDPATEKVLPGIQQQSRPKLVSKMSVPELKTELAQVSSLVIQLREQLNTMKNGKSKTKKRSRILCISAYKEKLLEILKDRKKNVAMNQKAIMPAQSVKAATGTTDNMAGISTVLTETDPQKRYEIFMSKLGDEHNKISIPISEESIAPPPAAVQKPATSAAGKMARLQPSASATRERRVLKPGALANVDSSFNVETTAAISTMVAEPLPMVVDMTGDSSSEEASSPPHDASDPVVADEKMEALRLHALMSIPSQKKSVEQGQLPHTASLPAFPSSPKSGTSTPNRPAKDSPSHKKTALMLRSPKVKPLIINLGEDSSESDSETLPKSLSVPAGLDSMLKELRQQSAASTNQAKAPVLSPTTMSITRLPADKQEEYRRLKERKEQMETMSKAGKVKVTDGKKSKIASKEKMKTVVAKSSDVTSSSDPVTVANTVSTTQSAAGSPARPSTSPARPSTSPARPSTSPARPSTSPAQPSMSSAKSLASPAHPTKPPIQTAGPSVLLIEPLPISARTPGQPVKSLTQPFKSLTQPVRPADAPAQVVRLAGPPITLPTQSIRQPFQAVSYFSQAVTPTSQTVLAQSTGAIPSTKVNSTHHTASANTHTTVSDVAAHRPNGHASMAHAAQGPTSQTSLSSPVEDPHTARSSAGLPMQTDVDSQQAEVTRARQVAFKRTLVTVNKQIAQLEHTTLARQKKIADLRAQLDKETKLLKSDRDRMSRLKAKQKDILTHQEKSLNAAKKQSTSTNGKMESSDALDAPASSPQTPVTVCSAAPTCVVPFNSSEPKRQPVTAGHSNTKTNAKTKEASSAVADILNTAFNSGATGTERASELIGGMESFSTPMLGNIAATAANVVDTAISADNQNMEDLEREMKLRLKSKLRKRQQEALGQQGTSNQAEDKQGEGKQIEGKQIEGKQIEGKQREGKQGEGKQIEGKQGEGKQIEGKQGEGKQGEGKQGEGKQIEGRQIEGRQGEGKQGEGKQIEGKQGEGKQGEGKQIEGKQGEGKQGEGKQIEGKQGEGKQGEGKQGEGKQGESKQVEGKQIEGKQGEGKQGEGKQGEGKQIEGKQGESKQVEGKQGEGKQGEGKQIEGKQGEGRQGEGKQGEGKQGEGKQGESKQGESKQGESKQGESKQREGEKGLSTKGEGKPRESKKKDKAEMSKAEDLILLPKLSSEESTASPPAKRRRSMLEAPDPKATKDELTEVDPSASSSASPSTVYWSFRQLLTEDVNSLPHLVQQLMSEVNRTDALFHNNMAPLTASINTCTRRAFSVMQSTADSSSVSMASEYSSVLTMFSTYRLSAHLQSQERFSPTSSTFYNAVQPNVQLCRYDLHGTCNDPHCEHQHQRDYQLSLKDAIEQLRDISPDSLTESTDSFIERLRRTGQLTDQQILAKATSLMRKKLKAHPPHTVQFDTLDTPPNSLATFFTSHASQESTSTHSAASPVKESANQPTGLDLLTDDDIMLSTDSRYYHDSSCTMDDMEKGLMAEPTNVSLWMKLAHKKLSENRRSTEAVYEALHIVSLALDHNPNDLDLWTFYLKLYGKQRPADRTDYLDVCEKALINKPSYHVFMLYIDAMTSASMRLEACAHVSKFLSVEDMKAEEKSFAMLQNLLYSASLVRLAGYEDQPLLMRVLDKGSAECQLLTRSDWLLAVYYAVYDTVIHSLPVHLMQGRFLTTRAPIPFNWTNTAIRPTHLTEARNILDVVLTECRKEPVVDCPPYWAIREIYLQLQYKTDVAKVSESWLMEGDHWKYPDFHLFYLRYLKQCGDVALFKKACEHSSKQLPHCSRLHYFISLWTRESSFTVIDKLSYSVRHIHALFDKQPRSSDALAHADYLYRVLLDWNVPATHSMPPTAKYLSVYPDNLAYCSLSYGYFLETRNVLKHQTINFYECSLSRQSSRQDAQLLCWRYLVFRSKAIGKTPSDQTLSIYLDVVNRCLTSLSCKLTNPEGRVYLDFSFHNKVMKLVADTLNPLDATSWYERCLEKYPQNLQLIARLCELYMSRPGQDYVSVRDICQLVNHKSIANEPLWNLLISVTVQLNKTKEAQTLARRAVTLIPHSLILWKKYLTIMLSIPAHITDIRQAVNDCRKADIHINEFFKQLPAEVTASELATSTTQYCDIREHVGGLV